MRDLTSEDAKQHLASVSLKIGSWGQVCDISERPFEASEWINHAAPIEALPLYCFSHRVLRWLDLRTWALVQMDDSTNFAEDEDFLVSRLMFGPEARGVLLESRSFLFEFGESAAPRERWLLGDILHMMLLFGAHCQVVSAGSIQGKHLSIQDGYVYFLSRDSRDMARAAEILRHIEEAPLETPSDV
jgi:hypothetical protein